MLRQVLFSVVRFNPPFMTGHRDAETQSNFQGTGFTAACEYADFRVHAVGVLLRVARRCLQCAD